MSKKYSRTLAPLDLDLTLSRWLRGLQIAVAFVALAAIICTPFPWMLRVVLAIAVSALWFWARSTPVIYRLQFDRGWRGWMTPDLALSLQLDSAVVWPMLIVLRFRNPGFSGSTRLRTFPVVLLPDSLDRDGWRRLRLFLSRIDVFGAEQIPAVDSLKTAQRDT